MDYLTKQLDLRLRHPNFQRFLDFNENESERVRNQYNCHLDQTYGKDVLQNMDIFPSSKTDSPVLMFIHGGYWKALDKKSYSYIAEPFVKNGFTVCLINYRLLPKVDMTVLIHDIAEATEWIKDEIFRFNGNPNNISMSGHSAGGHLALITYLMNENLRVSIKAICSLSGIFDLEPIRNSYLNKELQLNKNNIEKYSPLYWDLSVLKCPTLLSVGGNETEFYIEQSKKTVLKNSTNDFLKYFECDKLNHYQIVHELGQENSAISQFIFKHANDNTNTSL